MSDETSSHKTSKGGKPLNENDIVSKRSNLGRRAFMGVMAAGTAGAVLAPTQAAASDVDNGAWTDSGSCPRGGGGVWTGVTDQDNGAITDSGDYGRGAPYC